MFIKSIIVTTSLFIVATLGYMITTRNFALPTTANVPIQVAYISTSEKSGSSSQNPSSSLTTNTSGLNQVVSHKDTLQQPTSSVTPLVIPSIILTKKSKPTVSPIATSTVPVPTLVKKQEEPTTTKVQEVEKVTPIQTSNVYEHLDTDYSDTGEMYHPPISPCTKTMGYKLGIFDTRFGISKKIFLEEVAEASSLWGVEVNKTLFVYDEQGPLTINLIYDERQASTDNVNNLAIEIENSKHEADAIHNAYEEEKKMYTSDGDRLQRDTDAFTLLSKEYAAKVEAYNQAGGATKEQYDAMTAELASLKEKAQVLDDRHASLLQFMSTINDRVKKYNELIIYINTLIRQSNALGTKKFTEGRFTPRNTAIDIYQYNDTLKLRRVLAHELGHALGIGHNTNSFSIMYSNNNGTAFALTREDTEALLTACLY